MMAGASPVSGQGAAAPPLGPSARTRLPMAWVAWRMQRTTLAVLAGLSVLIAALLVLRGLQVRSAFAALAACGRPNSGPCNAAAARITDPERSVLVVLNLLPVVVGMFVGAPMLAREFAAGTQRFAWAQGIGRGRWLTAMLAVSATFCVALACALGLLAWWWLAPYRAPSLSPPGSPWPRPYLGEVTPVPLVGWTLLGLTMGAALSVLLRQTIRAVAAAGAAMVALTAVAVEWLRPALLHIGPMTTSGVAPPGSYTWGPWLAGPGGHPALSSATVSRMVASIPQSVVNANHVPQWWAARHIYFWLAYQPASRFWLFQFAELGVLVAVSAVLTAVIVRAVRRSGG
jgi:hypothetical protein